MIVKLINRVIITTVLISINLIAYADVTKGKYYEKDGCIYLIRNLTEEEKRTDLENYKQRMAERTRQVEAKIERGHELKIETIKAQAMRDYLIAQGMPLREIADAFRRLRIRQSVVIGNTTNTSEGGSATATGGTSTASTGTIINSATGGVGGTSTHNDY